MLGTVEETDFEEQMLFLSDENARLASRLEELSAKLAQKDFENARLAQRVEDIEQGMSQESQDMSGVEV
jgi:prefoldin subunit 5